MCEVNVYMLEGKEEKLIFEAVCTISKYLGGLCLEDIFGKRKYIKASINEIELFSNRIVLERIDNDNKKI